MKRKNLFYWIKTTQCSVFLFLIFSFLWTNADAFVISKFQELNCNVIYSIFNDSRGNVWFCTDQGVFKYDGTHIKQYTTQEGLPDNIVFSCAEDMYGNIWFRTFNSLLSFYNFNLDTIICPFFLNNLITQVNPQYDINTSLFFDGNSLFYEYEPENKTLIINFAQKNFTLDNKIFLNSIRNYINYNKDSLRINIRDFSFSVPRKGSLTKLIHKNILEYKKDVLISINNVVFYLHEKKIKKKKFPFYISSMVKYDSNSVLLTSKDGGLYFYNFKNNVYEKVDKGPYHYIIKTSDSFCWLASLNEIFTLSWEYNTYPSSHLSEKKILNFDSTSIIVKEGKYINVYVNNKLRLTFLPSLYKCSQITPEHIYISHGKCLLRVNKKNNKVDTVLKNLRIQTFCILDSIILIGNNRGLYFKRKNSLEKISSYYVNDIKYHQGYFYVATNGYGIIIFDKNFRTIETISTQEGLYSNFIKKICVDSLSQIWGILNYGLVKIERKRNKFYFHYFDIDRFGKNTYENILLKDGHIYLLNSRNKIKTYQFIDKSQYQPPRIFVDKINTREKNFFPPYDTIRVSSHDVINIHVSSSSIPFKIKYYEFIIKSEDEQYKIVTTDQDISLKLKPHYYTIFIKSVNELNIYSDPISIDLHVIPRWYETNIFKVFIIFISLSFLYLLFNVYTKHKSKRYLQRIEITELKLRTLNNQLNSHLIWNILNNILHTVKEGNIEKSEKYILSFSNYLRNVLVSTLASHIQLDKELKLIESYLMLEKLRYKEKLTFQIHNLVNTPENYQLPTMCIQPFLENSLKYGFYNKKENEVLLIKVNIELADKQIIVTITDNGPGYTTTLNLKKDHSLHRGLDFVQKKLKLFSHSYFIISNIQENGYICGTRVQIFINLT
ncbi:MAG: histidine kinase [Bacteroidales bacterium]|nr:histidine kinase [Bacteroidales bacterium]